MNHKRSHFIFKLFLGVLFGIGCLTPVNAAKLHPALETDREAATLARISVLLDHVAPLIAEAKRYQNPQARVQFRYDQLQQDIDTIKAGIQAKFHPALVEARTVTPIEGDYLRFKRKVR